MIEGLVYKVAPYQEHAKLLFTYTSYGKITLIAQGAQKIQSKDRVLAQYLTHITFEETQGKHMFKLKSGRIENDFSVIKASYENLKSAALVLELLDKAIVDSENHREILSEALKALNENVDVSSLSFAVKLLHTLGYFLNLKPTGAKVLGFSIKYSRLIYQDEQITVDLDTKDARILLLLNTQDYHELETLDGQSKRRIKQFILKYYAYHLQVILKTLE